MITAKVETRLVHIETDPKAVRALMKVANRKLRAKLISAGLDATRGKIETSLVRTQETAKLVCEFHPNDDYLDQIARNPPASRYGIPA